MNRIIAILELVAFYTWEVIKANITVARDVLGNQQRIKPGFIDIEINELTERQMFVLANMITMTPGSLSLDISPDKRRITLHTLYSQNKDELQATINRDYERRILNVL